MDNFVIRFDKSFSLTQAIEEQIRELRTSILKKEQDCSSILFTSTYKGEGKSLLSLSLAVLLSRCGKKTIWLDCNFHNGKKLYYVTNEKEGIEETDVKQKIRKKRGEETRAKLFGITEYLEEENNLKKLIYTTKEENLDVIPSGKAPKASGELLEQEEFESLLNKLSKQYEYIIVDSSCITERTDSKILASKCDGVVLVIAYNKVKQKDVKNAIREIEKYQGTILGAILNKAKVSFISKLKRIKI